MGTVKALLEDFKHWLDWSSGRRGMNSEIRWRRRCWNGDSCIL